MKEKDLRPGTVFPVLGTLLFFLPERYKEKLCCVTPLASEVNHSSHRHFCFPSLRVDLLSTQQPRGINSKPYQTGRKDGVFCSEDESDGQDKETKVVPSSCQIVTPCLQETAL